MALKKISLHKFPVPGERYFLEECLGSGAFAKTFQATNSQASNKKVAIKIQKIDGNTEIYVEQEYKILRDFSEHPNLPDFYGVYRRDAEIWFVMELCENGPVIDLVNGLLLQNRCMNEEHIAYILKETVKALIFLHENSIIHRDVKAQNILLTRDGEVKLADFGFSSLLNNPLDKTDTCLGSPCWMAPEVIISNRIKQGYDNRVDVWSLGITAIELGDGKPPFQSMHPTRTLFQITTNPPPTLYRPRNWSESYVDFINECLVKNPEHRPYMVELIDHPFLTQIPENNYHLTLEVRTLVNDVHKLDLLPKSEPEVVVIGNHIKYGVDGEMKTMYVEDLASLDVITENNILKLLENRMNIDQYQTFIGDILITLNPNEKKNIFGEEYHKKYKFKSRSDNAPHIYAVADSAYQNILHHMVPQRIVLTGESGSGKTTNYLHIIDHLHYLGENKNINLGRLRSSFKLIHSLTHASTPINDYSTRSVLTTDVKFGNTGKVTGAVFNVYQLEKWRISSVDIFQGNFCIFYHIYDGLQEMKKLEQYHLFPNYQYRYLRLGDNVRTNNNISVIQNFKKFKQILKVFEDFGIEEQEIDTVFCIIAAILLIGEIRFEESDEEGAYITNKENIEKIAELLKIEANKLDWALTNYCLFHKGIAVRKRSTIEEARDARDVFANTLYVRLVDYIVAIINKKLATGMDIFGEKYSIKIFDYFGFECFRINHLPQLLINTFNEQVHYHYLQRIFSWESLEVLEEELEYQPISYYDNKKTLDQLLSRTEGILSLIDDTSKTGHSGNYVLELAQNLENSNFISVTNRSEFAVAHFTGKVTYNINEMPDKNRDFLPPEIIETLRLSDNSTIKSLFANKLGKTGNLIISFQNDVKFSNQRYKFRSTKELTTKQYSQIKKMRTAIGIFKTFSLEILRELSIGSGSGGTHFVHCIRTDLKRQIGNFDHQLIKQQIRALAVKETAIARQKGYPHRISFSEFLRRYQFLAFEFDENVEITKENCRLLLIRLKIEDWVIGKSKVFLKYYNEEYLSRLYEIQVKKIIKIQSILRRFLAKCSVTRQIKEKERECISIIGKQEGRRMTEEEAAAIIQKAYRESTSRKSYSEFAKDYKILDQETCNFIRGFAYKWKHNSLFSILIKYRAMKFQDMFNFAQQIHLYNIECFYKLQEINEEISLDAIDTKAQISQWLGESKLTLTKMPFRLDDIPFYDTSGMRNQLTNLDVSMGQRDSWDLPYRWRELISSKSTTAFTDLIKNEDDLIHLPYSRDPNIPLTDLSEVQIIKRKNEQINLEKQAGRDTKVVLEEYIEEKNRTEDNDVGPDAVTETDANLREISKLLENSLSETKNILLKSPVGEKERNEMENEQINSNAELANKDFDYIKPVTVKNSKSIDPIQELKNIGQQKGSDDGPPFNFQGMLRKTNFNRYSVKHSSENVPTFFLKKKNLPNDENQGAKKGDENKSDKVKNINQNNKNLEHVMRENHINGLIEHNKYIEKIVKVELAPGLILEGIEVEI